MFGLVPFKMNNKFMDGKDGFDSMFKDFFGDDMVMKNSLKVDIKETENGYTLEADFPGMKKDDINIEYNEGYLTISGEKKTENEDKEKKENYIRKERYYEKASRSFYVGNILEVTLPKEQKAVDKNNKIAIE